MQKSNIDVTSYGIKYTCRGLEHDIWHNYIEDLDGEDYLAYHWKTDKKEVPETGKGIKSFNVLIKTKEKSIYLKLKWLYLIIILTFALFTEILSTYAFDPLIDKLRSFSIENETNTTNEKSGDIEPNEHLNTQ